MRSEGPLNSIRMNASVSYRRDHGAAGREVTEKLTQNRILTNNDIDALTALEFAAQDILQKYHAAMRQMEARLETLDQDLKLRKSRNPIHHIESRMKAVPSIFEKLERYGKDATLEAMEEYIMDIAGLRVIVSYVQDAYAILDYLEYQDDLEVVAVKDYIANPKKNGYRSLHLIVRIPIFFLDGKKSVPVEIQIRTIAMDFWASLEHDLKYKSVYEIEGVDVGAELKACSRIISGVEKRMQILANALEENGLQPREPAVEKAKRMNWAQTVQAPAKIAVELAEDSTERFATPLLSSED